MRPETIDFLKNLLKKTDDKKVDSKAESNQDQPYNFENILKDTDKPIDNDQISEMLKNLLPKDSNDHYNFPTEKPPKYV